MNQHLQQPPTRPLVADLRMLLAVVTAGLLTTAAVYSYLREAQNLRLFEQRSTLAETVRGTLDHDATSIIESLRGAALMAGMQPDLAREQFNNYARRLQATQPGITALEWQRPDRGIAWRYPETHSDWGPDAGRLMQEARQSARLADSPMATAPFQAAIAGKGDYQPAVAVTIPVYPHNEYPEPSPATAPRPTGIITALIDVTALTRDAARQALAADNELIVQDRSAGATVPLFSTQPGETHVDGHDMAGKHWEKADFALALDFGSRQWDVLLHPKEEALENAWTHPGTYALLMGLAITGLLAALLARSQANRRRSEAAMAQEQALREELLAEQYRLNEVVGGTGVSIWEYDVSRRVLSVSERWHAISGYSREELGPHLIDGWFALVHPDDTTRVASAYSSLRTMESDRFECEYRMRQKAGQWMWVKALAHVVARDATGKATQVAGINLVITREKEAEIRIHTLNATLETRMEEAVVRSEARATLGTLIAGVSHEMATPMGNSMMTASTLVAQATQFERQLEAGTLKRSELAQFVRQVQDGNELLLRNLERAVALLKNFRQVAADQASEQRRSFDLQQSLREVLDTLAPSLKHHKHRVVLDVPDGIAMDSYPGPLGQVVINLINNAYLHAFDGLEDGEMGIRAVALGDSVTLVCTDNGQGIAPDTMEKMFQPFFSTRIGSGGTGLGMSIVESLVKNTLGGTIEVSSTPGEGTTFTITLPRSAPQAPAESA